MRNAVDNAISWSPAARFASINPTEHRPLLQRPISVSIVVERQGEGWYKAEARCGVWATAHFTRLAALVDDTRRALAHAYQQQDEWQSQVSGEDDELPATPPACPPCVFGAGVPADHVAPHRSSADGEVQSSSAPVAAEVADCAIVDETVDKSGNTSDAEMIPFLPLIVVRGHEWIFLAATKSKCGRTVCF
jgi:hypothetical protein